MPVRFKKTYYDETEAACVRKALGGVDYVSQVKERLGADFGKVYLTTSGSSAFDLLFCALDFKTGSEVIVPSYTFPSVANTVLRFGLKPVFAEIDRDTKTLDIRDVKDKITDKTCCVVTTHYGGASVDMDELRKMLGGILLIEDAALAFGATYKGCPMGSLGDAAIFSFHHTKNLSCEQGGALILSDGLAETLGVKIQRVYDLGTDKTDFFAGTVPEYTWRHVGLNAVMPNTSAAILYAQLEKLETIIQKQRDICEYYAAALSGLPEQHGIHLPAVPDYNQDNHHVFYLLFETHEQRESVRKYLSSVGVEAYFHYMPLHASSMGRRLGYRPEDLPVTQLVSRNLLRLPVYASLTQEESRRVVTGIGAALC